MQDEERELWDLIEPYLGSEGVELDDLELLGGGRKRVLRVTIDAEGGVDIERIAEVSRNLSRLLDAEARLSGPYTLEVSSPGLERKLRRPAHFRKAVGKEVLIKARDVDGVVAVYRGVLVDADDQQVVIESTEGRSTILLEQMTSARTVFEMKPAPRPGKRR
jgi:ribosome maturation factor RimP